MRNAFAAGQGWPVMRLPVAPLLAALLLAGCAANDAEEAPPAANETDDDDADMGLDIEPEPVAISLFERPAVGVPPTTMGISPATLSWMEDKPYLLQITNDGQSPHDLVIEGLDADTDTIASGDTLDLEVIPQERGEYAYYCSVGGDGPSGHRAQGMQGTLTVA